MMRTRTRVVLFIVQTSEVIFSLLDLLKHVIVLTLFQCEACYLASFTQEGDGETFECNRPENRFLKCHQRKGLSSQRCYQFAFLYGYNDFVALFGLISSRITCERRRINFQRWLCSSLLPEFGYFGFVLIREC